MQSNILFKLLLVWLTYLHKTSFVDAAPVNGSLTADRVNLGYATYQGSSPYAGVTQYLGMRFAAPPLGDLRWRAPQDPLKVSGIQDATKYLPVCVGISQNTTSGEYAEDCLFVNVFTPSNATSESKLPVWLYIQGGGYTLNYNGNYNGTEVVRNSGQNVVLVTFNYRVAALGFLFSEKVRQNGDLNVGLLDQRQAMKWVQQHISQFGGDPDHVVIHGVSAGAGSVALHMAAYGGRDDDLFVGSIAQSPFFPTIMQVSELEWQFERFAVGARCGNASDQLDCLRSQSIETLTAANVPSPYPGQTLNPQFYFTPTIDGDFIREHPVLAYQQGKYVNVPLMVGDDINEGNLFGNNATSPAQVSEFMLSNYPRLTAQQTAKINELYPKMAPFPQHAAYFPSSSLAYGEASLNCPGKLIAQSLARSNGNQTWTYLYNVTTNEFRAEGLGVPHTVDNGAIFGPYYLGAPTTATGALSYATYNAPVVPVLMDYYISFVRTLNPNKYKAHNATNFEQYLSSTEGSRLFVDVDRAFMQNVPKDQAERCNFWYSIDGTTEQ